jgi:signal transduction histidine kinase
VPSPAKSPGRILVVDDDHDARQVTLDALTGSGYYVKAVKDGAAGWAALGAKSYDLIITDNTMPRMTGLELLEKLHSARRAIPVIMATEFLPSDAFARKPWLKPDATLQRPFSNDDLLAAVRRVLRTDMGSNGRYKGRTEQALRASGIRHRRLASRSGITESNAQEETLRQFNVKLEQRVLERTAELQATNQELEAFSYSVSHDLRTPLRHVMGYVELLRQDAGPSLSKQSLQHLTTIWRAAKRMGQMVDDLLAFSRTGKSEMLKREVSLDRLVQEVLRESREETQERDIVWEIHSLPAVRADRALLRLVLVNLISNAVKFTGALAEAKIEIGCVPSSNGETVIFIRDNGAGFDPHDAGKLFGVFQRLHTRDEFEGTGIGLANVQRIIQRHGGRTWAEGVVDGGATFYFSIPKQQGGLKGN